MLNVGDPKRGTRQHFLCREGREHVDHFSGISANHTLSVGSARVTGQFNQVTSNSTGIGVGRVLCSKVTVKEWCTTRSLRLAPSMLPDVQVKVKKGGSVGTTLKRAVGMAILPGFDIVGTEQLTLSWLVRGVKRGQAHFFPPPLLPSAPTDQINQSFPRASVFEVKLSIITETIPS